MQILYGVDRKKSNENEEKAEKNENVETSIEAIACNRDYSSCGVFHLHGVQRMRTVNTDITAAEEKAARRAYHRSRIDCHVVCAVITLAFLALGVFEFFGSVGGIIEAGGDFGVAGAD